MEQARFIMFLCEAQRQTGRTTALAKACIEIGGVFVTATEEQARQYKKRFPGLDAIGMSMTSLIGIRKPVIFDHYAYEIIVRELYLKYNQLINAINDLRENIASVV